MQQQQIQFFQSYCICVSRCQQCELWFPSKANPFQQGRKRPQSILPNPWADLDTFNKPPIGVDVDVALMLTDSQDDEKASEI